MERLHQPLLFNLNSPACCQSLPAKPCFMRCRTSLRKGKTKKTSRTNKKQATIEKKKSNETKACAVSPVYHDCVLAEAVQYSPAVIEILSKYTAWRCVCPAWHRLLGNEPLSNYLLLWRGNLASTPLPRSVLDCPFPYWSQLRQALPLSRTQQFCVPAFYHQRSWMTLLSVITQQFVMCCISTCSGKIPYELTAFSW